MTLVAESLPQGAESVCGLDIGHSLGGDSRLSVSDGQSSSNRESLGGLRGVALAGEDDDTAEVLLQALDVGLEALNAAVDTTVVNSDADGAGVLGGNASSLDLLEGETTASTDLVVVALGGGTHDRPQEVKRTRSDLGGLVGTGGSSGLLLASLVKVHANVLLPVLSEVVLLDWVVLADRHPVLKSESW